MVFTVEKDSEKGSQKAGMGLKTLGDLGDSPAKGQAMPAETMIERSENDKVEDLTSAISGMDAELQ